MSLLDIVLVFTTFAGSLNAVDNGTEPLYRESEEGRLVGGRPDKLPFLVLVEVQGVAVCSAALITIQWAVTAAHCVEDAPPSRITLRAGFLQPEAGKRGQTWEQQRRLRQVELFPSDKRLLFDMALLHPRPAFRDTQLVTPMPVCRNWAFPLRGELCMAAGWQLHDGSASARGGGGQHYLPRYILVHVLNHENCEEYYGVRFHRSMVCAKAEEGRSLCLGDGGGPLVCRGLLAGVAKALVDNDPQRDRLLTSRDQLRQVACGGNRTFMAYTAVGMYRRWLGSHVRNMKLDWLAKAPPPAPPPPLPVLLLLVMVVMTPADALHHQL